MELLTQAEASRRAGCARSLLTRWVKQGRLKKHDGKVDLEEVEKLLNREKTGDETGLNLFEEQARHQRVQRELKELELKKRQGELVEIAEVGKELEKLGMAQRQKFLGMGTKLAPRLKGKTAAQAKKIIDDEIEEILSEFASTYGIDAEPKPRRSRPAGGNKKGGRKTKASAKADRRRVGK